MREERFAEAVGERDGQLTEIFESNGIESHCVRRVNQ